MSRFSHVPLEIPEAQSCDLEEMYAFLGAALFVAQGLELEVANLIVGVRARGKQSIVSGETSAMFEELEGKTFGRLLAEVRKHAAVSAEAEELLRIALQERNRLVHHFISEHDENLHTAIGRRRMINDLRAIMVTFRDADAAANAISTRLWSALGLTPELVEELRLEQLERIRVRDGTG